MIELVYILRAIVEETACDGEGGRVSTRKNATNPCRP